MKKSELTPTNQHQLVLYYLLEWECFSLKDVINDSMFFKLQTRLSEIEHRFGTIAKRTRKEFTNRFGRKSTFLVYEALDRKKIEELYKIV